MLFKGSLDPQNKFLFYLLKKKKPQSSTNIYIYIHTQKFTIVEMICYDIDV